MNARPHKMCRVFVLVWCDSKPYKTLRAPAMQLKSHFNYSQGVLFLLNAITVQLYCSFLFCWESPPSQEAVMTPTTENTPMSRTTKCQSKLSTSHLNYENMNKNYEKVNVTCIFYSVKVLLRQVEAAWSRWMEIRIHERHLAVWVEP